VFRAFLFAKRLARAVTDSGAIADWDLRAHFVPRLALPAGSEPVDPG
jgi:hypothetical protein